MERHRLTCLLTASLRLSLALAFALLFVSIECQLEVANGPYNTTLPLDLSTTYTVSVHRFVLAANGIMIYVAGATNASGNRFLLIYYKRQGDFDWTKTTALPISDVIREIEASTDERKYFTVVVSYETVSGMEIGIYWAEYSRLDFPGWNSSSISPAQTAIPFDCQPHIEYSFFDWIYVFFRKEVSESLFSIDNAFKSNISSIFVAANSPLPLPAPSSNVSRFDMKRNRLYQTDWNFVFAASLLGGDILTPTYHVNSRSWVAANYALDRLPSSVGTFCAINADPYDIINAVGIYSNSNNVSVLRNFWRRESNEAWQKVGNDVFINYESYPIVKNFKLLSTSLNELVFMIHVSNSSYDIVYFEELRDETVTSPFLWNTTPTNNSPVYDFKPLWIGSPSPNAVISLISTDDNRIPELRFYANKRCQYAFNSTAPSCECNVLSLPPEIAFNSTVVCVDKVWKVPPNITTIVTWPKIVTTPVDFLGGTVFGISEPSLSHDIYAPISVYGHATIGFSSATLALRSADAIFIGRDILTSFIAPEGISATLLGKVLVTDVLSDRWVRPHYIFSAPMISVGVPDTWLEIIVIPADIHQGFIHYPLFDTPSLSRSMTVTNVSITQNDTPYPLKFSYSNVSGDGVDVLLRHQVSTFSAANVSLIEFDSIVDLEGYLDFSANATIRSDFISPNLDAEISPGLQLFVNTTKVVSFKSLVNNGVLRLTPRSIVVAGILSASASSEFQIDISSLINSLEPSNFTFQFKYSTSVAVEFVPYPNCNVSITTNISGIYNVTFDPSFQTKTECGFIPPTPIPSSSPTPTPNPPTPTPTPTPSPELTSPSPFLSPPAVVPSPIDIGVITIDTPTTLPSVSVTTNQTLVVINTLTVQGDLVVTLGSFNVSNGGGVQVGGNLTLVSSDLFLDARSEPLIVQNCLNIQDSVIYLNISSNASILRTNGSIDIRALTSLLPQIISYSCYASGSNASVSTIGDIGLADCERLESSMSFRESQLVASVRLNRDACSPEVKMIGLLPEVTFYAVVVCVPIGVIISVVGIVLISVADTRRKLFPFRERQRFEMTARS